jgi:hypothetical protein
MMYCYRFPDQDTFMSLAEAEALVFIDEDGSERLITDGHNFCIDVLGTLYEGGEWDPQTGEVIAAPVALGGYHCNTIGLAPESWDQYLVVVNSPARVFLGGPTQAPDTATLEAMAQ